MSATRHSRLALIVALAGAAPAAPAIAQQSSALLVGIDEYVGADTAESARRWRNLEGAVNDIETIRDLLVTRFGFAQSDVRTLLDEAATRRAILDSLQEMLAAAAPGDTVVFYYSGHGSQVANSRSSEADRLDESLVPADANAGAPDIRDKELRALFGPPLDRGVDLVVILDSCHSGSATRGLPRAAASRAVAPDRRDVADGGDYGPPPADRGALVISAARPHEVAREIVDDAGRHRGAFSAALADILATTLPGTPAQDLFARVRARMQSLPRIHQEPTMEALPARRRAPLFGRTSRGQDGTRIAVTSIEGVDGVGLQAGAAVGLSVGARVATADRTIWLEVVAIDGPEASRARIVEGNTGDLEPGDLLDLIDLPASPATALRYWIPPAVAEETGDRLADLAGRWARTAGPERVPDPTAQSPTHVVEWDGQGWSVLRRIDGERSDAGDTLAELRATLPLDARVFVSVPPTTELVGGLEAGSARLNALRTASRDDADYWLVGRSDGRRTLFAWVAPGATDEAWTSTLPIRSDWVAADDARSRGRAGRHLADLLGGLGRLHGWLTLEAPPSRRRSFPYALYLRDAATGDTVDDGGLVGDAEYQLVLRAPADELGGVTPRRHVYVFAIDPFGDSVLLYPDPTQPPEILPPPGDPPPEILLGAVRIGPPYGHDTYVTLVTQEPLLDPLILQFSGVRSRGAPAAAGPLERLLATVGAASRGAAPARRPIDWSIRRIRFRSRPPDSLPAPAPVPIGREPTS